MGRAPEGEVWDLSCQGLFRRHEWEAGNRPVSGCTSLHAAKARQADWILETSVVQALSSLHLEGMAGRAIRPAIPSQQRRLLTWRGRHSLWTEAIAALILGNKNKVPGVP